jgi:hypothetical protein
MSRVNVDDDEAKMVSKKDTAHMLGISSFKLDQLLHSGKIAAKMIDSRVMFQLSEIKRYVRECPSWEPTKGTS